MKELKKDIENVLEDYKDRKIAIDNMDGDLEFEIHCKVQEYIRELQDKAEELDAEIDDLMETWNEPSLWEQDYKDDCRQRTLDLIGG